MIISNKAAKKARIQREVSSNAVLAKTTKMQVLMVFGFRVARSIVKPDNIDFAILHVVALHYRDLRNSSNTQHCLVYEGSLHFWYVTWTSAWFLKVFGLAPKKSSRPSVAMNTVRRHVLLIVWVVFIASASWSVSIDVIYLSSIVY